MFSPLVKPLPSHASLVDSFHFSSVPNPTTVRHTITRQMAMLAESMGPLLSKRLLVSAHRRVPTSFSLLLANLHITTLGHGYSSAVHVPHDSASVSCDATRLV